MNHSLIKKTFALFFSLLIFSSSLTPTARVLAQALSPVKNTEPVKPSTTIPSPDPEAGDYSSLMKQISDLKRNVVLAPNQEQQEQAFDIYQELAEFQVREDSRLGEKGISGSKRKKLDRVIRNTLKSLEPYIPAEERPRGFFDFFTQDTGGFIPLESKPLEIDIPKNPGGFHFEDKEIEIKSLDSFRFPQETESGEIIPETPSPTIRRVSSWGIPKAHAQTNAPALPLLADLQSDDEEITIDGSIERLAQDLNNNPVEILNFVRNHIEYEPYYGAKKGSLGCLKEHLCNDIDTSSLLISLLRAAGIPAKYRKSMIIVPVEQLQNLLGVDTTKTAYAALAWNGVPIYTVNSSVGTDFEAADLSNETHLAIEWVSVEAYLPYDERGGNFSSLIDPGTLSTDQDLQDLLANEPNLLWLDMDGVFRQYERTINPIVPDDASFDIQTFWTSFFSSSTALSPLNQLVSDLQSLTGKDITDEAFQSFRTGVETDFEVLPPSPPYVFTELAESGGQTVETERWTLLPDKYRFQVTVSVLKASNESVLLRKEFFGSEINNLPLNLLYEGATQADKDLITQYGGIHATPASLVSIIPVFSGDVESFTGTGTPTSIGDQLLLRFEVGYDGVIGYTDDKFSVAGNSEGIYIVTSQVQRDAFLDSPSKILLEGNPALAREYLGRIYESDLFAKALDHSWNMGFARAVVTQNRILSEVSGSPTTFTFKGLTIDATSYVVNYSNRGDYDDHITDFRLLLGLESSYQEARLFKDIAGLEAVSTVNGLQHAYQNPAEYTTSTITADNASLIDTLNLSFNTQQNMRDAVQNGRTIITADKPITIGEFSGVLYVSYDPSSGEANYAIGEQTQQNGGVTSSLVAAADGFYGPHSYEYKDFVSKERTFFQDNLITSGVMCNVSDTFWQEMRNNTPGYNEYTHGFPCYKSTFRTGYPFGEAQEGASGTHTTKVFTRQTYFSKPNDYSYWKDWYDIAVILYEDKGKDNHQGLSNIKLHDKKFQFNVVANTFSWFGSSSGGYTRAYYQPMANGRGHGRMVYGEFLDKLTNIHYSPQGTISQNGVDIFRRDWILRLLGYPTSNRLTAAESQFGTNGYYQNFIGGQIYLETNYFNETFYVPSKIEKYFNQNSGTTGKFGFPAEDPKLINGNVVSQKFENGIYIDENLSTNTAYERKVEHIIATTANYSNSHYEELKEGILDSFYEHFGLEALLYFSAGVATGKIIDIAIKRIALRNGGKLAARFAINFVPVAGQITWVIQGVAIAAAINQNYVLVQACQKGYETDGQHPAYYCGRLLANIGLMASGLVTYVSVVKLNKLGVIGKNARAQKTRLYNVAPNSSRGKIESALARVNQNTRSEFNEKVISELTDADIKNLVAHEYALTRMLKTDFLESLKYRQNTLKKLESMADGNLTTERIKHIILGEFSAVTGNFGGGGLHSRRTLQKLVENNQMRVANKNVLYSNPDEVLDLEFVDTFSGKSSQKTFFPASWSDEKIIEAIKTIAHGKSIDADYTDVYDGVEITVVFRNGHIETAFPIFSQ